MSNNNTTTQYLHLGIFSDWVAAARRQRTLWPHAAPGRETQQHFREALGFCNEPETALDYRIDGEWQRDGIAGQAVSWSVGYGPRTEAWVLKPAGETSPLPGIVALHDHGGYKFYGKEKIADGPNGEARGVREFREMAYGGRAFANALAREGYVVQVHDTFLWGSRRFPLDVMCMALGEEPREPASSELPPDIAAYNDIAGKHEHVVSKYCNLLGTNVAGMVCRDDRIATNVLLSRDDVLKDRVGCIGLSGGGNRGAMLLATHDSLKAAVIVGLMSTYEELLDRDMSHTWMLFPFNWSLQGDWPDVAACRAPAPLLVQYDLEDDLFTPQGMRDADARIAMHYRNAGAPDAYSGAFYPGPHKFDLQMQTDAFRWLRERL